QRVNDGALAPVEVLPFETRLASLEESVISAQTDQRRRSLALARQMGTMEGGETDLAAEIRQQPQVSLTPMRTAAVQQALSSSPEIKELEAQLRLAQEQIRTSGDSYRPRLDVEGYVQVAGVGNQEVSPAFEQVATARATSVHVGLVYELPLDDARKSSERARDLLAVQIAEQRLLAARQRIQTEVETLLEQERAARIRLEMAEKTAEIAEKQVAAATERFEIGVGISVEVQQAEDELRKAKLRAVRARIDLVEAEVQRHHSTGQLLSRIADLLASSR
ncbi:MAG TPA: TolC family protein, partial [Polyangiaceae bacterium]|nr:TolC family protein [Polyangiaceae bacterium]